MTVDDAVTRITGRAPAALAAPRHYIPASERRARLRGRRRPPARRAWHLDLDGWVLVRVLRRGPSRQLTPGTGGR
jgi:hypothetical protein